MDIQKLIDKIVNEILETDKILPVIEKYINDIEELDEKNRSLVEFYTFVCCEYKEIIENYIKGDFISKELLKIMLNCWAGCKKIEMAKYKALDAKNLILIPVPKDCYDLCSKVIKNISDEDAIVKEMKNHIKEHWDMEDYIIEDHVRQFYQKVKENGGFESYAKDYQRTKTAGQKVRDS